MAAEGDIRLQAAQNTASLSGRSSSSSGSIGVRVGQQTGITVSASKGRGNQVGDDLTHTDTHIAAGNSVTLQLGGDTKLQGAVVNGKQVIADVGGDLNLQRRHGNIHTVGPDTWSEEVEQVRYEVFVLGRGLLQQAKEMEMR